MTILTPAKQTLASAMSERKLSDAVGDHLTTFGWLRHCNGWQMSIHWKYETTARSVRGEDSTFFKWLLDLGWDDRQAWLWSYPRCSRAGG